MIPHSEEGGRTIGKNAQPSSQRITRKDLKAKGPPDFERTQVIAGSQINPTTENKRKEQEGKRKWRGKTRYDISF